MTWDECKSKIIFLLDLYNNKDPFTTASPNWLVYAALVNSLRHMTGGFSDDDAIEFRIYLTHVMDLINHQVSLEGYCG